MIDRANFLVFLTIELVFMTIPYYVVNLYEVLTRSKSFRRPIQRRQPRGIELEKPSVFPHFVVHFLMRTFIWFFQIFHGSTSDLFSFSLTNFLLKLIFYDFLSTIFHLFQHSNYGKVFNHFKHHQLKTPTIQSSTHLSLGELILSNHLAWILVAFIPGSFWDNTMFLVISSTIKRLCHSDLDHPWESSKVYRLFNLVSSRHHHVHHLYPNKNYADIFTFWDRLMGTFLSPDEVDKIHPVNVD